MKKRHRVVAVGLIVLGLAYLAWRQVPVPLPVPTVLSLSVGQTFQEVVAASTYPVVARSNVPTHAYLGSGETFVTEPSVIIRFNDPEHGFILPPTKFALVGYLDNRVVTVSTSPMLDKLEFQEAVAILENLQNQFKAGGWEPWQKDGSEWFDFSPAGKQRLHARMFTMGFAQEASLRVPGQFGMTFRLRCAAGCDEQQPPYLFLIDIGLGKDID